MKDPIRAMESSDRKKTIMIIAGEASGDMYGAGLVREMLKLHPTLSFYGIGGKRMREEGVELLADASHMAVVGLTEAVSKLGSILTTMTKMKRSLDERRPDLVILIDYPDFNLSIAKAASARSIKVLYYISPQVWAWRQGRIRQIKKTVTQMAVILPFEVDTYRRHGFAVHYVGHPLLDMIKMNDSKQALRTNLGLAENRMTIGILPGSRLAEVKRLLPELLRAAALLVHDFPDVQCVLPLADTLKKSSVDEFITASGVPVRVISGRTYDVIACSDLVLVASGTATLEVALLKVPMVIVYKVSLLSYVIGRLIVDVKNIGLVNIIAGKTIVPELIQGEASGERIAGEALSILNNGERKQDMIKALAELREKLGTPGAAARTAMLALDML